MTGYAVAGKQLRVTLSDGRQYTESDGMIRSVDDRKVVMRDGTEYWRAPFVDRVVPRRTTAAQGVPASQVAVTGTPVASAQIMPQPARRTK